MSNIIQFIASHNRQRPSLALFLIRCAIRWGIQQPAILFRSDPCEIVAILGMFGGPGATCIIVASTHVWIRLTTTRLPAAHPMRPKPHLLRVTFISSFQPL